jgi:hypothetical protein
MAEKKGNKPKKSEYEKLKSQYVISKRGGVEKKGDNPNTRFFLFF